MIVSTLSSHLVWKFVAVGVFAIAGMVALPFLVKAGLGVIGFGAAGPVAGRFRYQVTSDSMRHNPLEQLGSAAACIQSLIGNVAAGSLFATAQSLAMGGGAILLKTIGAFIGGVFGAAFF